MKTTPLPFLGGLAAVLCLAAATSFAQVKIPAKSSSTLDETASETGPTTTAPVATPSANQFPGKSGISRVTTPSSVPGEAKISRQPTPVADAKTTGSVVAMQRVEGKVEVIDKNKIDRLAELRRELRVADAASQARIALPTDDLFESNAPTTLDDLALPTLKKVVEYIQLNDKQKITVNSYYIPDQEGGKELAWSRSLALIEWMAANSTLGLENFKASGPMPVTKPTPKKFAAEVGEVEFVNRTELVLER